MGYYINPKVGTKEQLLYSQGIRVETPTRIPEDNTKCYVCLVDNGFFTAGGIAFSNSEIQAFAPFDGRPKRWFLLDRQVAQDNCQDGEIPWE